jgi:hypothetical protein
MSWSNVSRETLLQFTAYLLVLNPAICYTFITASQCGLAFL